VIRCPSSLASEGRSSLAAGSLTTTSSDLPTGTSAIRAAGPPLSPRLENLHRAGCDAGLRLESGTEKIDPFDAPRPDVQENELLDHLACVGITNDAEPPGEALPQSDLLIARGCELED